MIILQTDCVSVKYVPSWFPGAGFKRKAAEWKKELAKIDTIPHAWAKEQIVRLQILFLSKR